MGYDSSEACVDQNERGSKILSSTAWWSPWMQNLVPKRFKRAVSFPNEVKLLRQSDRLPEYTISHTRRTTSKSIHRPFLRSSRCNKHHNSQGLASSERQQSRRCIHSPFALVAYAMPTEIGPFDGRKARRKRCDACVKRRIKCRDGMPCNNCKRAGRLCTMAIESNALMPVFVSEKSSSRAKAKEHGTPQEYQTVMRLPPSVGLQEQDRAIPYFFVSFLPMNILANDDSINSELQTMTKTSSALRDAIQAVGILHRDQQDQVSLNSSVEARPRYKALQAYDRAVRAIQGLITSNTFLDDPSALWTTFLLGLFELMRDSTGTNWLSHFLQGTCTILRLQHPETLASPGEYNLRKRKFFFATRIFEIARALIYSEPTFLSAPDWVAAISKLRDSEGAAAYHPKEALFDILPIVAELSIRTYQFCETIDEFSLEMQCFLIQSLADEGMLLQRSLLQWCVDADRWRRDLQVVTTFDAELFIAYSYYDAISIYLSGTYDYHSHWSWPGAPCAPILPRSQIDWHVAEVLRLSQELLASGVSGVLLFFPLRVAGARAIDKESRSTILDLLHTTARRGFIVAEAFTADLSDLWASQSSFY
ncbi:hypothetical protein HBH70_215600 [Parastagonospora nodorum]|nr:hypothetical protein HBH46_123720 [Parastagonospora nodorum]KAH5111748.1 hypothetical protein HBH71_164030 [Parastagonospora nodorum]KAH5128344.1 hypothetical protein HBH70_215600 [Parastagonospora nodorum]KAH5301973.1 hypothetical protein HBI11_136570 [Parastagonospora nodorum]KAH5353416.1 hypothetical protein HBI48_146890 [Parastagonospora nodorum]